MGYLHRDFVRQLEPHEERVLSSLDDTVSSIDPSRRGTQDWAAEGAERAVQGGGVSSGGGGDEDMEGDGGSGQASGDRVCKEHQHGHERHDAKNGGGAGGGAGGEEAPRRKGVGQHAVNQKDQHVYESVYFDGGTSNNAAIAEKGAATLHTRGRVQVKSGARWDAVGREDRVGSRVSRCGWLSVCCALICSTPVFAYYSSRWPSCCAHVQAASLLPSLSFPQQLTRMPTCKRVAVCIICSCR